MEFLKEYLDAGLYEQVSKALEGNDKVQIINLADGGYVPQADLDTLKGTIDELLQQIETANPEGLQAEIEKLKGEKETEKQNYEAQLQQIQMDAKLEARLIKEGAVNTKAVKALLDSGKITMDGDNLAGLDEQLAAIRESDAWAFKQPEVPGSGGNPPIIGGEEQDTQLRAAAGLPTQS